MATQPISIEGLWNKLSARAANDPLLQLHLEVVQWQETAEQLARQVESLETELKERNTNQP